MDRSPAGPSVPPPAAVPGNRWTELQVPSIGGRRPTRTVTVVVPFYQRQSELDRILAGLTQQTYRPELMEVIIADDGSARAPVVPSVARSLNVAIHTQEHRGYGLARARNLGARVAQGEVLVFLDGDMIPERQHVEAHVRWHDAASGVVTIGARWHADFSAFSSEEVAAAAGASGLAGLVADQDVDRPEWMERYLARSDRLMAARDDLYRVMSGGNLGIRRDLYLDVGGSDETLDRYGAEDRELGFRLLQEGVVVVPEQDAVCWHQGAGALPSESELEQFRLQRPVIDNLIAEPSYRNTQPGRSYTVPFAIVTIDAAHCSADRAARTVESILASGFHDLVVVLRAPDDADDAEWLRRKFRSDARLVVTDYIGLGEKRFRFSPLRISIPVGVLLHQDAIETVVQFTGADGVGALYLDLPSGQRNEQVAVVATRALNRARLVAGDADGVGAVIERLFGELRDDGAAFGLGVQEAFGRPDAPELVPRSPVRGDVGEGSARRKLDRTTARLATVEREFNATRRDLEREQGRLVRADESIRRQKAQIDRTAAQLVRSETKVRSMQRRRSVRFAAALGELGRARSAAGIEAGLLALWRSLRPAGR